LKEVHAAHEISPSISSSGYRCAALHLHRAFVFALDYRPAGGLIVRLFLPVLH